MNEVIDLLDSDDEEVKAAEVATLAGTSNNSDDEVEVVGVHQPPAAMSAGKSSVSSIRKDCNSVTKSQKTTSFKTSTSPHEHHPRVSLETPQIPQNLKFQRQKNPYSQTTKQTLRAVSQSSQNGAYDSDSSDDSLFNAGPTFASKKVASAPPCLTTQSNANSSNAGSSASRSQPPAKPAPSYIMASLSSSLVNDPLFRYPALLNNSKQYEDLRPKYILAFWRCARRRVQHSYERAALDQLVNKIVILALTPYPIRSLEEYRYGQGFGGGSTNGVETQLIEGGLQTIAIRTTPAHSPKKYFSIVEACLVAMLTEIERRLSQKNVDPRLLSVMDDAHLQGMLREKGMWISLEDLIPAIDALLKPECPARMTRTQDEDNGAAHYTASTTRSAEFLQIRKLETCHRDLGNDEVANIKRHHQRGKVLFELTHVGFKSAKMVRERTFPLPPNFYRCSRILRVSQVADIYDDICVGIDLREGGGAHNKLHEMCNTLDTVKLPFFVASLKIGDYVFFTRGPSGNLDYLCPIIIERKSIEDIAKSIHDDRWQSQKQRMYIGQFVFGYKNCRMVYIIEGKEEKQQVTGGHIGHRMYNVDMQRLQDEIENLKTEGFEVLRTPSRKSTMFELARWAKKVAEEVKSGVLKAQYTYAQFNEQVKKIPRDTDFSWMAKYEAKMRQKKTESAAVASKRPHDEVSSDVEVGEVLSLSSGSKMPVARPISKQKPPLLLHKKPSARSFPRADISNSSFVRSPTSISEDSRRSESSVASVKKPIVGSKNASGRASLAKKPKVNIDAGIYADWTCKQLQDECVRCGVAKSGTKAQLIERLKDPHPPELYLRRKQAGQYVPSAHNVGGTALLVALYLYEKDARDDDRGLTKDELYAMAEGLCITKNPFCGGTTQTGPYHYDGWSSMKELLHGDPPLVTAKKCRYKLTRNSEFAGYPLARAMHQWCHEWGNCPCGDMALSERAFAY